MMRHLVLVGAGFAHLQLLAHLRQSMPADLGVTVITRQQEYVQADLLVHAIARGQDLEQATVDIPPLLRKTGVRWLQQNVQSIHAADKTLLLDDGRSLHFDWLSIDLEAAQNRDMTEQQMPGARANGLFLFPQASFCNLWPRVAALALDKPLRVALIADTAESTAPVNNYHLELALAIANAFKGSALTLVTKHQHVAMGSAVFQTHVHALLKRRNITILHDTASAIQPEEVLLASGARLACDVPLVATPPDMPLLLFASDLQKDESGQIALDGWQRSGSHPWVFVPGQSAPASLKYWLVGLTDTFTGKTLKARAAQVTQLANAEPQLLACGTGKTLVVWVSLAWQSRMTGYLHANHNRNRLLKLLA